MNRFTVLTVLAALAVSAGATTFTVDWKTGDDVAAAADPTRATPFATITAAVALAADRDVVQVKPGTYDAGVVIEKAVTLEATSADPADTVIDGKGEAICVACNSAGAIVKGFTLCNGFGTGGGFHSYAGTYTDGATIVDCVIRDCAGGTYPAIYGGCAVRCRIVGSVDGAVRYATLVNCLVSKTRSLIGDDGKTINNGTLSGVRAYNCTIVDIPGYALRASVKLYNSVVMLCKTVSAGSDAGIEAFHSVTAAWPSSKSTPDETSVTDANERCFLASAAGDWRPMEGSVLDGRGDASYLAGLQLPEGVDPYVDLAGRPIPKTGVIAAGAFQETVSPETCSGLVVFGNSIGVNDYQPGTTLDLYCRTAKPFEQIRITGYPSAGAEVIGFENPDLVGGMTFPDMDEVTWFMMPPNGVVTTNKMLSTTSIYYVNPETGKDDGTFDGLSPETPWNSFAYAFTKASSKGFVIHAAEGVYTNGYKGISRVRIEINNVRIKGAGKGKSFIYGQKATGKEDEDDGRGADSLRALQCTNSRTACVQGFTLAEGYSLEGTTTDPSYKGGVVYAVDADLQVTDCELGTGYAARGSVAYGGIFKRCVFTGNRAVLGTSVVRAAKTICCLVADNPSTDQMFFEGSVRQATIRGSGAETPVTSTLLPVNVIVANAAQFKCASARGCLTDATDTSGATCTKGDPCFRDAANGDYRLLTVSPGLTCGSFEPDDWKYYSPDLNSRPLVFIDGKLIVGALQNPVAALVTSGSAHCGISPEGVTPVEAGESVTVSGTTGDRPALDLVVDGESIGATSWTYTAPTDVIPTVPITVEAVYQTNLYVNANAPADADETNDGFSPATPKRTFAGVMPLVISGDTVHAAAGTYDSNPVEVADTPNVRARILIDKPNVRIVGDEGAEKTFIVGAPATINPDQYGMGTNSTRCVFVADKTGVRIENLTLTGARTRNNTGESGLEVMGGAVCAQNTDVKIVDCIISNNYATWAAATRSATLIRCKIIGNLATQKRGVSHGSDACGCIVDYNRVKSGDQGLLYDFGIVVGCTFGAHNYASLTATTVASPICVVNKKSSLAINSLFLGQGPMRYKNGTGALLASNCAFASAPDLGEFMETNNACQIVSSDCVDGDFRPVEGSSLVDAGDNSVMETYADQMSCDLDGSPRVSNRTIDIGCYEFDWRPAYSAALGATVSEASAGVKLVDGALELLDGDAVSASYAGPVGKTSRAFAQVLDEGELSVSLDGEPLATVTAADARKEMKFRPAADVSQFDFAFVGEGAATVFPFAGPAGMLLLVR